MAFLAYLAMFYAPLTSIAESTAWFANFFSTSRRICDVLAVAGETQNASLGSPARPHPRASGTPGGVVRLRQEPAGAQAMSALRSSRAKWSASWGEAARGNRHWSASSAGFTMPDGGQILIDGIDVRQNRSAAAAPADRHGSPGAPSSSAERSPKTSPTAMPAAAPEQILAAAKQADAHDFIMRMPLAYSTQLGEGGSGLSGGERQRLSIARALALRSRHPHSRRGHGQRRRRIGKGHLPGDPPLDATADGDRHRPPSLDPSRRRPAVRLRPGPLDRSREPPRSLSPKVESTARWRAFRGTWPTFAAGWKRALAAGSFPALSRQSAKTGKTFFPRRRPSRKTMKGRILRSAGLIRNAVAIENDRQGELRLISPTETIGGVYALRAFPTECERQFLSLCRRDEAGRAHEVGMIDRLTRWPRAARKRSAARSAAATCCAASWKSGKSARAKMFLSSPWRRTPARRRFASQNRGRARNRTAPAACC